jgi:hypothetical protein
MHQMSSQEVIGAAAAAFLARFASEGGNDDIWQVFRPFRSWHPNSQKLLDMAKGE